MNKIISTKLLSVVLDKEISHSKIIENNVRLNPIEVISCEDCGSFAEFENNIIDTSMYGNLESGAFRCKSFYVKNNKKRTIDLTHVKGHSWIICDIINLYELMYKVKEGAWKEGVCIDSRYEGEAFIRIGLHSTFKGAKTGRQFNF